MFIYVQTDLWNGVIPMTYECDLSIKVGNWDDIPMTLLFFEWPQFCRQAHCNSFAEAGGLWAVCIMLVEDEAGLWRERVLTVSLWKMDSPIQPNTARW